MINLIEKIEGEAQLRFDFKEGAVDFVDIEFLSTRGIETILEGKPALDALVINPRVCGICGHAHLIATAKTLEACYGNLTVPKNAEIIRELTLNFELIQNHFKWFYLTILPLFGQNQHLLKATRPTQLMAKAIATFGGQYPHTSYAVVGGVACEPVAMDIVKVRHYLNETISFFAQSLIDTDARTLFACADTETLLSMAGDLPDLLRLIKDNGWERIGGSYDRFLAFGANSLFVSGKSLSTRVTSTVDTRHVTEFATPGTYAKNVVYKGKYYETGPLARAMIRKIPLIRDVHRRYKDSIFSRITARACEILQLLDHSLGLLDQIDLDAPFYAEPPAPIESLTGSGTGAVEAARGSLIHRVELDRGTIVRYDIITPTQWNLSNGTREEPGVSQKAMLGLQDTTLAEIAFKSYDVCSVCTTH
jgi:hydrogenase large subunit